jgi:hypothetical protein
LFCMCKKTIVVINNVMGVICLENLMCC